MRQRIIDKAGQLFYQNGIRNVSMDEIASSLGISKRTIYEIFKDKEEILTASYIQSRDEHEIEFSKIINSANNVIDIFLKIIDLHKNSPIPNIRFYEDIKKYYPKIYELINEDFKKKNVFFVDFFKKGIEEGMFRENLNIEAAAFLVDESTFIYFRALYMENPPYSFKELFLTMIINFIRGVSTEKGIQIVDEYLKNNPLD